MVKKSREDLHEYADTKLLNNTSRLIKPEHVRTMSKDIVDSMMDLETFNPDEINGSVFDLSNQYGTKPTEFPTVAALIADTNLNYSAALRADQVTAGEIITAQGFRYEVAPIPADDYHIATAGGVLLYVVGTDLAIAAFGVVGDGVADDTAQIEKALLTANARNGGLRGEPNARYRITENIKINREGKVNLLVDLNGATLVLDEGDITFGGNYSFLSTTLEEDVALGDSFIPLPDVSGLAPGDLLLIDSPAHSLVTSNTTERTVHTYLVNYVESGGAWIVGTVVADITQQQIIDSGESGDITVRAFKLAPGLVIQNVKTENTDTLGLNAGIHIEQQFAPRLNNIICDGHTRQHIFVRRCSHDIIENCVFTRMGYTDEIDPAYENLPGAPNGRSWGYGIMHVQNYFSQVINCSGSQGWHVFDAGIGQMHINYQNCSGFRCAYSFSVHGGAWHVNYINCENHGAAGWALARGIHVVMDGCRQVDPKSTGWSAITLGKAVSLIMRDCEIEKTTAGWNNAGGVFVDGKTNLPAPGVLSAGQEITWIAQNNKFSGRCYIDFGNAYATSIMSNNKFFEEAYVGVLTGGVIELHGERYAKSPKYSASVAAGASFTAVDCRGTTAPEDPTDSAMFTFSGAPASVVARDCHAQYASYLLRFSNPSLTITVREIVGGSFSQAVLGGSNVTINNIINTTRTHANLVNGGCTVTKDENNHQLTT